MHQLATEFWTDDPEPCRVSWCYDTLKQYFNDTINACIEKDLRIACCEIDSAANEVDDPNAVSEFGFESVPNREDCLEIKNLRAKLNAEKPDLVQLRLDASMMLYGSGCALPNFDSAKRLIDVGSCYNPFAKFEDVSIDVIAVDLTPACQVCISVAVK